MFLQQNGKQYMPGRDYNILNLRSGVGNEDWV